MRTVQREIDRLALVQIDTVNVLARAHLMPLFTRLGAYDSALLDRASGRAPRRIVEYWAHEAALLDVHLQPAFRWKMQEAEHHAWGRMVRIMHEQPHLVDEVLDAVRDRGPLTARDLDRGTPRDRTNWGWNWSDAKTALEWLFYCGEVSCLRRNSQFERVYDLPERVIPADVMAQPTPSRHEAHVMLARRALSALGVATSAHIADYFRLGRADTEVALTDLESTGEAVPVIVEGWRRPAWTVPDLRIPRRIDASGLLSPFDSLVFHRQRLAELFGVDYRIEIYTPAAKRVWGYYVYLYLLEGEFVARVDLKADRARSVLLVQTAWREPGCARTDRSIAANLAGELRLLADWLGLEDISVQGPGDLAEDLGRAVMRGQPHA